MQPENNNPVSGEFSDDFKNLTDISPAATCIVADGKIIYMNTSCLKLLGTEAAGDIVGKDYLILFHPDHRDNIARLLEFNQSTFQDFSTEERLNRSDGQVMTAMVAAKSIKFRGKPAFLFLFNDITESKETENELRISQEHYRSLLSKLPDYVFIQVDGKIVYVNESMLKTGSYDYSDVINRSIFSFVDEKYHRALIESINRRISASDGKPTEIELVLKSGKRKTVLSNGELIRYENKNALLFICVDITERRETEERLRKFAEELQRNKLLLEEKTAQLIMSEEELKKLNASKDKFFSIIAHDLRGPFNGLLGISNFLAYEIDSLENEEIHQFAIDINDAAQSIYKLLNNLLEWARLQTESNCINPTSINLSIELTEVISILKSNIEEKSIQINADINRHLNIHADKHMLRSILQNLIANAVKFTNPNGSISIHSERDNGSVKISITDTGVGMNSETLSKLFRIDENVSTAGTNNEKGTGLGLILCKEFAESNKGTISVESKAGKGSTFTVTLPEA